MKRLTLFDSLDMKYSRMLWVLLFCPALAWGQQVNRYFVRFTDKAGSPYSLEAPLAYLSQKSLDRRQKEGFISQTGQPVTVEDLPPNPSYLTEVKQTGAEVYYPSRWMNGVLIQTTPVIANSVASLSHVQSVTLVAPDTRLAGGRVSSRQAKMEVLAPADLVNMTQLQMIGIDLMHAAGYHGEGVDIAVFDAGFPEVNTIGGFSHLFTENRIKGTFDFVTHSTNAYVDNQHGTATLSILAGNQSGYQGGAYKANFYLFRTEDADTEYVIEEYNWAIAAERADSAGVDVISSSLGYFQFDDASMDHTYEDMDGVTAISSISAHRAAQRGIVVVNSAGNEGAGSWHYLIAPSDAVGVICVGAVDATETKAAFSSFGPSADGRVKPDVSAMGVHDVLFSSAGCCFTGNGTSFSCPLIAGLVADMRQQFPNESAGKIYNRLIKSSSQYNTPDNALGYGIPNFRGANFDPAAPPVLDLYPNPVQDTLHVNTSYPNGRPVQLFIYNSAGQKVTDFTTPLTLNNNPFVVDLSALADGIYFVRANSGGTTVTRRISKRGK